METNEMRDDDSEGPANKQFLRYATLGGATPGMADAMGMLALFTYLSERDFSPLKSAERGLARLGRTAARLGSGRQTADSAPADMVPVEQLEELFREVRRHQWLEAEKAGKDIWAERNPHDPDAVAFRDWAAKHYSAWRSSRGKLLPAR